MPVEIAAIFTVIGYATQGVEFFNQLNDLNNQQFEDATTLLRDIHQLVIYSPDKALLERIDAKYDRFVEILDHWDTIDNNTKTTFANEILYGDGSVDNAIRRFHKSVYAPGGYFEEKTNSILDEECNSFLKRLLTLKNKTNGELAKEELNKFFPTLLEVEMKATTLILFGYHLEKSISGEPSTYQRSFIGN